MEPVPTRAKALSRHFHRLAGYNRDGAVNTTQLHKESEAGATELAQLARDCKLPQPAADAIVEALPPHVSRADHLGVRYQGLRDFSAKLWPATAAVVVSLMAFQIIFLPAHYWLAWVELAVLLLVYVSYRVSRYDAWHEKWLNDRRLAEGLRGALFVALVRSEEERFFGHGRVPSIISAFGRVQDPLPFYSPANAWFVVVCRNIEARAGQGATPVCVEPSAGRCRCSADGGRLPQESVDPRSGLLSSQTCDDPQAHRELEPASQTGDDRRAHARSGLACARRRARR